VCDKAGLLFGWSDGVKRVLVTRANCDSWSCVDCRERMADRWGLRAQMGCAEIIRRGEVLSFVTITSHEKLRNFADTERVWQSAWTGLYHALKRKKSGLAYMIVPERHKDGRMHIHALWNANVSQKWLKDNARKRGLGYQCKIIPITNSNYAAKYITKYVCKDFGSDLPTHFRRVRVSSNWVDIPKPTTEYDDLRWEYVGTNGALSIVYDECQSKGIAIIDMATGEVFDDIDLGTIVAPA